MSVKKQSKGSPVLPEQFFDFYSQEGAKEMLWKWFVTTVTDGFSNLSTVEKENIISLYERLNELLDGMQSAGTSKPETTNNQPK